MTMSELWLIFRARWRLFAKILVSVLLLVLVVSLVMPKMWLAESAIVINTRSTDPLTGASVTSDLSATILATQTDVIESRNVALKAIDKLDLTKDPRNIQKYLSETDGIGPIRFWLADKMVKDVIVRPSPQSNVLFISFPAREPERAAQISNALAEGYIRTSLELNSDPARRESTWFDQENLELRHKVDAAAQRLAAEQSKSSMVGTQDHVDVDNSRLTEISTQLVTAQQDLYTARTNLRQMNESLAQNRLAALPDILSNPLLQTLKADLSRAEGHFADVSSRYDRNHPEYQSAEASVQSLRDKLAGEVESVRGSIEQSAQISQHKVDELQKALDVQKAKLLNEQRQHDSLDVLNRELDSAQRAYDAGMQRAAQVRVASQVDQSTVAILNPAVTPFEPARPKLLIYMAIAFVFGVILGLGICLLAEIVDPRVRSAVHIVAGTSLLVLAEVPVLTRKTRKLTRKANKVARLRLKTKSFA